MSEETGIAPERVRPVGDGPLHVDVHPIPANPTKGEAAHRHFDFRYLFRTAAAEVTALQVEEVTGCAWQPAGTIATESLRSRLAAAQHPLRRGFRRRRG